MSSDLITIVVPIYNVEKYLEQCITSLINQTYKNLEIILVDDGSPDNCGKICDGYANGDTRIKVIHKKNGGLSDARNHGIDVAKGKYITFVDSDDYVDSRYIEKLYNAIKQNNAKMSQCNILKVNDQRQIVGKMGYLNTEIKTGKQMIKDINDQHWVENVVAWNKMYEIQLFKELRYPIGKTHEDEFTTYKILYDIENVVIINDYLYNYRQSENSIMERSFNIKRLDAIDAFEERLEFFEEKHEKELYNLTLEIYVEKIREYYKNTKKYIANSEKLQLKLINKYIEKYNKISKFKSLKLFSFYIFAKRYYKKHN